MRSRGPEGTISIWNHRIPPRFGLSELLDPTGCTLRIHKLGFLYSDDRRTPRDWKHGVLRKTAFQDEKSLVRGEG